MDIDTDHRSLTMVKILSKWLSLYLVDVQIIKTDQQKCITNFGPYAQKSQTRSIVRSGILLLENICFPCILDMFLISFDNIALKLFRFVSFDNNCHFLTKVKRPICLCIRTFKQFTEVITNYSKLIKNCFYLK